MSKTLLITGAGGFIGANFVEYWLAGHTDDRVIVLDALTESANPATVQQHAAHYGERYEFVHGNICDAGLVQELVARVDHVVHFAAESHVDRSIDNPPLFVESNVVGTQTLLEAVRKHPEVKFHHISTDEVFGALTLETEHIFHEGYQYSPRSPYAASKAASDHIARAYAQTFGLHVTLSWCSNNYGPFQFPEKLVPLLVTRLSEDQPVPIYGDGLYVREWLYVIDHCRAIELIVEGGTAGEAYCIGGAPQVCVKDVAHMICDILGKPKSLLVHTADRAGHDRRYAMTADKIKNELGWKAQKSFHEGLEETVQWYQANRAWWEPISAQAHVIAEKYLQNPA